MRKFLFIFCLLATQISSAQNQELLQVIKYELSGKWRGKLQQGTQTQILAPEYTFELDIQAKDKTITGTSYIMVEGNYAKISFKGTVRGLQVEITEIEIIDSSIKENYAWCIKNLHLEFGYYNGNYQLKGKWDGKSKRGTCSPGTTTLIKETIRA